MTTSLNNARKHIDELVNDSEKDHTETSSETKNLQQLLDKASSRVIELETEKEHLNTRNSELESEKETI